MKPCEFKYDPRVTEADIKKAADKKLAKADDEDFDEEEDEEVIDLDSDDPFKL
jgi:hypothetical protein